MMFFPWTAPLAVLMSLPYAFNILLYVTFFAHQYLASGFPICGLRVPPLLLLSLVSSDLCWAHTRFDSGLARR